MKKRIILYVLIGLILLIAMVVLTGCDEGFIIPLYEPCIYMVNADGSDLTKVIGIYVGDTLIDKVYIDKLLADSVLLKINPVTSLVKKVVFDKDGKRMGKVIQIERHNNENYLTSLVVQKHMFSKAHKIPHSDIEVVGKNIILNKIM